MNNFNTINVKELPQLEQILAGNYLIVENNAGTNKLDFSDFVIGPQNTSFYNGIANDIVALSAQTVDVNKLKTDLDYVSSSVNSGLYSKYDVLRISANQRQTQLEIVVPIDLSNFNNSHISIQRTYDTSNYLPVWDSPAQSIVYSLCGVPAPLSGGNGVTYFILVSSLSAVGFDRNYNCRIIAPRI